MLIVFNITRNWLQRVNPYQPHTYTYIHTHTRHTHAHTHDKPCWYEPHTTNTPNAFIIVINNNVLNTSVRKRHTRTSQSVNTHTQTHTHTHTHKHVHITNKWSTIKRWWHIITTTITITMRPRFPPSRIDWRVIRFSRRLGGVYECVIVHVSCVCVCVRMYVYMCVCAKTPSFFVFFTSPYSCEWAHILSVFLPISRTHTHAHTQHTHTPSLTHTNTQHTHTPLSHTTHVCYDLSVSHMRFVTQR